jgi:probable HAF family extracellular repeat protein
MVAGLLAAVAGRGQVRYQVTDIAAVVGVQAGATAINDSGQMIGEVLTLGRVTNSFYFANGKLTWLPTLGGETVSASAINESGQIVGAATTADFTVHGFLYANGQMTVVDMLPGSRVNGAVAINQAGDIAGWANGRLGDESFLWSGGQVTALGSLGGSSTRVLGMNNGGQIVGWSSVVDFTPAHAFLYRDGKMFDLGTGSGNGSSANAINDQGLIVGTIAYPNSVRHAMLYADGQMTDLGTLGGSMAQALAINNAGVIVGTSDTTPVGGVRAFVYMNGRMQNLNALADLASAGVENLQEAFAINNRGAILCHGGSLIGGSGNYLLTPVGDPGRVANVSLRAQAGAGEQTLIVGFVVQGGSQTALIRASGPALSSYGVPSPLADPKLNVYAGGTVVAINDNWNDDPSLAAAATRTGAFPFNADSLDAALDISLNAGAYTAHVSGNNGGTGQVLLEVYDDGMANQSRLVNMSARGQVLSAQPLNLGFVIQGTGYRRILLRGVGPTLGAYGVSGVLTDPVLRLFSGSTVIQSNDDWGQNTNVTEIATVSQQVGAFSLGSSSKDAALLAYLPPGIYTATVSGKNGGDSGIALVELYFPP